uniref:C3H1-type domain-containing protein n=1 Tax=Amblyomma aureolatum TaxID=187763 RepID=A0A1E1X3D8_9ACAR
MSAAMVTSFFNDYSPNVMYGKNGGNFAAASRGPQQVLESRRHSSSSVAGHGMHHHGVVAPPPLRRSTSSVTPVVLRTTSPKPCRMPPVQGSPAGGMVSAAALVARTDHRKLDRSYSEPVDRRASLGAPVPPTAAASPAGIAGAATPTSPPPAQNSSRYKTELCRPFEESGTCKYGDKCQFAHGGHELRTLARHPKYKTELCRTFHTTGFCPYGPRCHFIHNSDESRKNVLLNNINGQQPTVPPQGGPRPKALSVGSFGSLGSAGELSPPSSPMYDDPFTGSFTPNSTCNTAFSFSQDFATLVAANTLKGPNASPGVSSGVSMSFHHGFGGSQPALAAAMSPFSALSLPDTSAFPFPALVGGGGAHRGAIIEGPPSPVDSLGSELDTMSVNGGGSPAPASCSSPLSRLPIFNRLANGRDSD